MDVWLAPHVRAARRGAELIFLDIETGDYLCLLDANQHLAFRPGGGLRATPPEAAAQLLEAGVLSSTPTTTRPLVAPTAMRGLRAVTSPAAEARSARPSARADWRALRANLRAAKAIKTASLAQILAMAGPLDCKAFDPPSEALLTLSRRFDRLAPWLPRAGRCLMTSLQQRLFLAEQGHSAAWVFGVRTWPFEAHCWLQVGDVVLDDAPDRVGAFTPILVV